MTSKEALNNLIEELKWCCNDGKKLTEYDKSMIEPIQKDLEILEILNKHYASKQQYVVGTQPIINVFTFNIPNEEAQKIEEWLE